jgi:plasmid stabilization system protein ParE
MGWKVIVSPRADSDLGNIVSFIARHNPAAASRIGHALIARAEILTQFPEMGRMVPEFNLPDLREIVYRSYRVIYRVKKREQLIEIVRFWHAARGLPHIPQL